LEGLSRIHLLLVQVHLSIISSLISPQGCWKGCRWGSIRSLLMSLEVQWSSWSCVKQWEGNLKLSVVYRALVPSPFILSPHFLRRSHAHCLRRHVKKSNFWKEIGSVSLLSLSSFLLTPTPPSRGEKLVDLLKTTTVEGVPTAQVAVYFADKCGLDLPIFRAVASIIEGEELLEVTMKAQPIILIVPLSPLECPHGSTRPCCSRIGSESIDHGQSVLSAPTSRLLETPRVINRLHCDLRTWESYERCCDRGEWRFVVYNLTLLTSLDSRPSLICIVTIRGDGTVVPFHLPPPDTSRPVQLIYLSAVTLRLTDCLHRTRWNLFGLKNDKMGFCLGSVMD
jgi:hypothetical protein